MTHQASSLPKTAEAANGGTAARRLAPFLAMFVFLVYLPSTRGGFVWDDAVLVATSRSAPEGKLTGTLLGWWSQHRGAASPGYYPARELSFRLDRELWGDEPTGYHLTNLVLHATTAILLYLLYLTLTGNRSLAVVAALLCAVHPAGVECAAWLKNRGILLCGLATAATLVLLLSGARRWRVALGASCAFAAALACKEMAVVAPVVGAILALVLLRTRGIDLRWPLAGLWAVLALYLALKAVAFFQTEELARLEMPGSPPPITDGALKTYRPTRPCWTAFSARSRIPCGTTPTRSSRTRSIF